jgi:hypothetical protein
LQYWITPLILRNQLTNLITIKKNVMNKNTFMYPVRMTAVLAAAALVTSCAKDKFTEANALDLELKRLRTEDSIRVARERQQRIWDNNRLAYQRVLDSLDRINAGGRVFYTVTVVAGGNAAFGSGRVEELEGVQGATVSIAQYGNIVTQTTPASGMVTVELRSGSANVVASAPNHTTVNYTVNLTADGNDVTNNRLPLAPGNGHTIHVGNVIPLFPTTGAGTDTVRGRAYIETDLTNETAEQVTPGVLGAGTNLFTANININAVFRARYLDIANQASAIANANGTAFEGAINRISYENATTNVVVDAAGNYSGVIPATASGLPIQLRYSQIAADRIFWASSFDNATLGTNDAAGRALGQVITRRFIYGPGLTADAVPGAGPLGSVSFANAALSFNTELAPATITAALTNTGALRTETIAGVTYFVLNPNGATSAERILPPTDIYRRGLYLADVTLETDPSVTPSSILPPAVTFAAAPAGGTTAVGIVELGPELGTNTDPVDLTTSPANSGRKFRRLAGIRVVNAGAGYTTAPTVTFTRRDGTAGTGATAGQAFVTGRGTLQAPTSQISAIQVIDGGFGYLPLNGGNNAASRQGGLDGSINDGATFTGTPAHYAGPLTITSTSTVKWTGMTPRLPGAPFTGASTVPTLGEVGAVFHYNAIGTIDRISLAGTLGNGITQAMIDAFNGGPGGGTGGLLVYGDDITFPAIENNDDSDIAAGNDIEYLFVRNGATPVPGYAGAAGDVVFNFTNGTNRQYGLDAATGNTATQITNFAIGVAGFIQPGSTIPYVFLPNISLVNVPNDVTAPGLSLSVGTAINTGNEGLVTNITLTPGSSANPAYNYLDNLSATNAASGISGMTMRITPATNSLRIRLFRSGSGIDNYVIDQPSQLQGRFISGLRTAGTAVPTPSVALSVGGKERDTYIVEFDQPDQQFGVRAEGRPVFNANRQLIGIDITNPGAGYSGNPNFRIIPNPFEGDGIQNAYVDDNASVSVSRVASTLTFTVVNGGQYAAVPDIILTGGGVTLAQQPANAANLSSITPYTGLPNGTGTTVTNGAFQFVFNSQGVIQRINFVGSLPAYNNEPITATVSAARQNDALNRAWSTIPTSIPATLAASSNYLRRVTSFTSTGALAGFSLRETRTNASVVVTHDDVNIRFWEVGTYANTTTNDYQHFANARFIVPPAAVISSTTGTGAAATVALQTLQTTTPAAAGAIEGITMTAGGTGYVTTVAGFNRNGRIIGTYNGSTLVTSGGTGARNFGILAPTDGSTGSNLTDFEAFSGVTYVRDVHYGTGTYFGVGAGR